MGLMDDLRGVLSGTGTTTVALELHEGERELARAVATLRPGRLDSVGGDLVLTDHRLVFAPLDVKGVVSLLTWALGRAGVPDSASGLPGRVGALIGGDEMAQLDGARASGAPSLLRPPTLVVTGSDGSSAEFAVLAHRRALSGSRANAAERDRMVDEINAEVARRGRA